MRFAWIVVLVLGALPATTSARAQSSSTPSEPCFAVIEGHADVAPVAPMLLDRCTGATFMLVKTRAGDGKAGFAWVPIPKVAASEAVATAPALAERPRSKAGCFSYNDRTYCP